MRYGELVSKKLIDTNDHKIYEFEGHKVGECSTAKKWNDKVLWYNKNIVILEERL